MSYSGFGFPSTSPHKGSFCTCLSPFSKCLNRMKKEREEFSIGFYVDSLYVELADTSANTVPNLLGVQFVHGRHNLFTQRVPWVTSDEENKRASTLVFSQPKLPKVVSTFFRDADGKYERKLWFVKLMRVDSDKNTIIAAGKLNVSNFIQPDPKMLEIIVLLNPVCYSVECVRVKIAVSIFKVKCGIQLPTYSVYDKTSVDYRSLRIEREDKSARERKLDEVVFGFYFSKYFARMFQLRDFITEWLKETLSRYYNVNLTNLSSSFKNGIIINALLDFAFPGTVDFTSRYDNRGVSRNPYTDNGNLKFALDYFSRKGISHSFGSFDSSSELSVTQFKDDAILDYLKRIKDAFGDLINGSSSDSRDERFILSSERSERCEKSSEFLDSGEQGLASPFDNYEEESFEDKYLKMYYHPDPITILNQTLSKNNVESSFYDELKTSRFSSFDKIKINSTTKAEDVEWFAEDLIADSKDSVFLRTEENNSAQEPKSVNGYNPNLQKTSYLTGSLISEGSLSHAPHFSSSSINATIEKKVDETEGEKYYENVKVALEDIRKKIGEYSDRRKQIITRFDSLKLFFSFLPEHEKRSYGKNDDDLFMKLYAKERNQEIAMQHIFGSSTQKVLESVNEKFLSHLVINMKLEAYVFENCKAKIVTSNSVMNDLLSCLLSIEELCREAERVIYVVPGLPRDYDPDMFIRPIDSELSFLMTKESLSLEERDRELFLMSQRHRLVDLKSFLIEKNCTISDRASTSVTKSSITSILSGFDKFRKAML